MKTLNKLPSNVAHFSLLNAKHHTLGYGISENSKKMSWVNPVFPIDTENSMGFIVLFFLS